MADKKSGSQKGKPRGAGKRKGKFDRFHARGDERKHRNVLKCSGARAAKNYANNGGSTAILQRIAEEQTYAGSVAREAIALKL